jgi:methyl-accepting chemotaxis protein
MLKWITNTPIAVRVFFTFAWATIIPIVVIMTLSNTYLQALVTQGRAVQTSNQTIKITTTELTHLQSMHALLVALLPSITVNTKGDAGTLKTEQDVIFQVLSIEGSFDVDTVRYQEQYQLATASSMSDIRTILLSNDAGTGFIKTQQVLLDDILQHQWPQYKAAQDNMLIGLDKRIPLTTAAQLLKQADALYYPLLANWQKIVDIAATVNTEVVKVGPAQTNPILIGTILAFIFSMMLVFGIGYLMNRTIIGPLQQLIALTQRVIRGEVTARSTLRGNNEIAHVASSMNKMLDTIVQLMNATQSQHDVLQGSVEKLAAQVRDVGEGNLRRRAAVTLDALGMFATSFNYMIDALSGLVKGVKKVAREVEHSTGRILELMTLRMRAGEQQVQQVFEATREVEQIASSSHSVANRAQSLYSVANQAQQSGREGQRAVWNVIAGIENIYLNVQTTADKVRTLEERSQEVNHIVEVISNIAHQTNRLALDSAIQAAIAGEHGQGFGAVAANIRKLAEQTKEEANTIARIVRSVREDIAEVISSIQETEKETFSETRAVQEVGEALKESFAAVERQAKEISSINQMAIQQQQLASKVAQIMQYISGITQQNGPLVDDVARNMQHLSGLVEQLRTSVDVFILFDEAKISSPPATASLESRRISSNDWAPPAELLDASK